jgi:ABC-type transporter Mla maintaining outer membrane lipid asymmetry ATPase subunit MlaF
VKHGAGILVPPRGSGRGNLLTHAAGRIRDVQRARLVKKYSGRTVLDSLTSDESGAIVGLPGSNGSGKTTLLRSLLGSLRIRKLNEN